MVRVKLRASYHVTLLTVQSSKVVLAQSHVDRIAEHSRQGNASVSFLSPPFAVQPGGPWSAESVQRCDPFITEPNFALLPARMAGPADGLADYIIALSQFEAPTAEREPSATLQVLNLKGELGWEAVGMNDADDDADRSLLVPPSGEGPESCNVLSRDCRASRSEPLVYGPSGASPGGTTTVVKRPARVTGFHPRSRLFGAGVPPRARDQYYTLKQQRSHERGLDPRAPGCSDEAVRERRSGRREPRGVLRCSGGGWTIWLIRIRQAQARLSCGGGGCCPTPGRPPLPEMVA
jgi:hypothetical protein